MYLFFRLFILQTIDHPFYSRIAQDQHTLSIELEPKRGTIFDSRMRVLAVNLNVDSVYANAREVSRKEFTARALAAALNMDQEKILNRLNRDKGFVWIKRKVSREEAEAVKRLKLEGINLITESKRFYPNGTLGCHFLGVADVDNNGTEGLELLYDKYLKGEAGCITSARDARRKKVVAYRDEEIPPRDGYSLVLTIDEVIQHIAERELSSCVKRFHAKGGSIVVMDPRNGDILAMANMPNFDLNNFKATPADSMRNRAICDFFEPGSVFKIVTASAVLEEGAIRFEDRIYCENGAYKVGSRTLRDHRPHGTLTFREVIEQSSNIGTVKAASRIGPNKMFKYIELFGFRRPTGIDLPGEVTGLNRDVSKWTKGSMLAIPMGQEVTATALQLARAVSAIANGGWLVKPRVVKEIIDGKGETIKSFPQEAPAKAISPETAAKVRELLVGVIERGTGTLAKVDGYTAGGKTGTAQKVEENGTYSHSRFRASFIGFAPADKPALTVVVCVDEPHPAYFGGVVAAPVFKETVKESLRYLDSRGALGRPQEVIR